jgi:hypothetical protein
MTAMITPKTTETTETTETLVLPSSPAIGAAVSADAVAPLVWAPITDDTSFIKAGVRALVADDMTAHTAGRALTSMVDSPDAVADVFRSARAAWRDIDAAKRPGAWSQPKPDSGKPSVPVFPSGNDVKRMIGAILGYAEGIDSPMPASPDAAPAPIGKIRSLIHPLVNTYLETDSYEETDRLRADDNADKTDRRVVIDDQRCTVYRPGPALAGPWIEKGAFSKACATWTLTGKKLKISRKGVDAATPTASGWAVGEFLSLSDCAEIIAAAGIVKDTKLGDMREGNRPALVCPAVSGADYAVKKVEVDSDMARRVLRSITDACGGKISAEAALFEATEKGGSARGALTAQGMESQAATADNVNFRRGQHTTASDWK